MEDSKFNGIIEVYYEGQYIEMPLLEAVELDKPEGKIMIKISATLLNELVNNLEEYENNKASEKAMQ